ncbi:MAG TPA: hypothetical protein VMZ06_13605 [Candidatus Bathyarchaeia archaeon]|nr:hypothetical protein [Candidatus Bathyarchaeia archaeon]
MTRTIFLAIVTTALAASAAETGPKMLAYSAPPNAYFDDHAADAAGVRAQGRACVSALLDSFPDAVIFLLPGELGGSPIGRAFTPPLPDERQLTPKLGYEPQVCRRGGIST